MSEVETKILEYVLAKIEMAMQAKKTQKNLFRMEYLSMVYLNYIKILSIFNNLKLKKLSYMYIYNPML